MSSLTQAYNSNQLHKKESGMVAAKAGKGGNGELPRDLKFLFFKMKQPLHNSLKTILSLRWLTDWV